MHNPDNQDIVDKVSPQNHLHMHNLKTNFDKFLQIVNEFLAEELNQDGNMRFYPNKPQMPDAQIIALSICSEVLGIDSENLLWSKLDSDFRDDFPNLPHRTNYNRRRKNLADHIHLVNEKIAGSLSSDIGYFILDSMPVPVCRLARERRCRICRESFETAPNKGYTASLAKWFYGYKLQLITTIEGVFKAMELTKASVHDVHFIDEIRAHKLVEQGVIIADRGYLSGPRQMELFDQCQVRMHTPMRRGQRNYKTFPVIFKKKRKRIETLFAQLCDQMMIRRNYAKSFIGLRTRLISKVAAVTVLQLVNFRNDKPINQLKHALAA